MKKLLLTLVLSIYAFANTLNIGADFFPLDWLSITPDIGAFLDSVSTRAVEGSLNLSFSSIPFWSINLGGQILKDLQKDSSQNTQYSFGGGLAPTGPVTVGCKMIPRIGNRCVVRIRFPALFNTFGSGESS